MKRILLIFGIIAVCGMFRAVPQSPNFSNAIAFAGQQAATGSAVALASTPLKTICVKALHSNTGLVYLGGTGVTTSTGMELAADQSYCANVTNANVLFLVGTGSISWIGTN